MYQQFVTTHHATTQKSNVSVLTQPSCSYSHIPNAETENVLKEIEAGIGLVECRDVDDMFEKLGI
jgi:peroxiredoxin